MFHVSFSPLVGGAAGIRADRRSRCLPIYYTRRRTDGGRARDVELLLIDQKYFPLSRGLIIGQRWLINDWLAAPERARRDCHRMTAPTPALPPASRFLEQEEKSEIPGNYVFICAYINSRAGCLPPSPAQQTSTSFAAGGGWLLSGRPNEMC